MHTPSLTSLLALAVISTVPALAQTTCYDYLLINTRGTGEPQGESIGFKPMINTTLSTIPNGAFYNTVYPAAPDGTQETTLIGSNDIENKIQSGLQECPSQRYALLGYSQGATVTNQVLERFAPSSPEGRAIDAVVLIGNPYHLPNKRGNVDDKCGTSTAGASGALLPTANYTIPDSWYDTGRVRDICYEGDGVCMGYDLGDLLTAQNHLYYGFSQSVQECGADFLIANLE